MGGFEDVLKLHLVVPNRYEGGALLHMQLPGQDFLALLHPQSTWSNYAIKQGPRVTYVHTGTMLFFYFYLCGRGTYL